MSVRDIVDVLLGTGFLLAIAIIPCYFKVSNDLLKLRNGALLEIIKTIDSLFEGAPPVINPVKLREAIRLAREKMSALTRIVLSDKRIILMIEEILATYRDVQSTEREKQLAEPTALKYIDDIGITYCPTCNAVVIPAEGVSPTVCENCGQRFKN